MIFKTLTITGRPYSEVSNRLAYFIQKVLDFRVVGGESGEMFQIADAYSAIVAVAVPAHPSSGSVSQALHLGDDGLSVCGMFVFLS